MISNGGWCLFLDDIRSPGDVYEDTMGWVIARSSLEAIDLVREHGMPGLISLDHDLGGDDTAMHFLKWLAYEYWTEQPVPGAFVHSANPVGAKNLESFMDSWKRSVYL